MAQHDMNIANQGFPATRADLNNALQALVSNSSGTSAPSTTFANQWWYDTTNNKMYIRNEANNAWIEVFTLDQTSNEWQLTTGVVQAKDSDGLALKTDDGTTRLFIKDSDGNIGLGTSSPSYNLHISSAEASACRLLLESTAGSAADGPILDLYRNSATPAADDNIGIIYFSGEDDAGNKHQYARMDAFIENATSGSEDGRLTMQLVSGGSNKQFLGMRADTGGADGEVVFNESQHDINFRIESDSATNLFFADAGTHRVGISTSSPEAVLHASSDGNSSTKGLQVSNYDNTSGTNQAINIDFGLARNSGSTKAEAGRIKVGKVNDWTSADSNIDSYMGFYVYKNNSLIEGFRYDGKDDQIRVGNTSGSWPSVDGLIFNNNGYMQASINGSASLYLNRGSNNGNIAQFARSGTVVGTISVTSSSTAYNTSSDHRLKENVETLSNGITRVKQLQPKRFSWIVDEEDSANVDGFLAHEAATVVPEAVTGTHNETEAIGNITNDDGETVETGVTEPDTLNEGHTWTATGTQDVYQGIDQSKLVPLLTAALQEAIAKIEALETRVAALEG